MVYHKLNQTNIPLHPLLSPTNYNGYQADHSSLSYDYVSSENNKNKPYSGTIAINHDSFQPDNHLLSPSRNTPLGNYAPTELDFHVEENSKFQHKISDQLRKQNLQDKIKNLKEICIDVSSSRHGKGDIAAGYLMALYLIKILNYKGKITLLATPESMKILSTLLGHKVTHRSLLFDGQVAVLLDLAKPKSASLTIALAQAGTQQTNFDFRMHQNYPAYIYQNVFQSTESHYIGSLHGWIHLKNYPHAIKTRTPGLENHNSGIYIDPIALELRGMRPDKIRELILKDFSSAKYHKDANHIYKIFNQEKLKGAGIGFVYGISSRHVFKQFRTYIAGLNEHIKKEDSHNKSFVLLTPSLPTEYDLEDLQNDFKIVILNSRSQLPDQASPGTIYIYLLKDIPHKNFNQFLAYSEYPPIVSGDNALSAAITIGKPFVMTRITWNTMIIESLKKRLAQIDPSLEELLSRLYEKDGKNLFHSHKLLNPNSKLAFWKLFKSIPDAFLENLESLFQISELTKYDFNNPNELIPHKDFHFASKKESLVKKILSKVYALGASLFSPKEVKSNAKKPRITLPQNEEFQKPQYPTALQDILSITQPRDDVFRNHLISLYQTGHRNREIENLIFSEFLDDDIFFISSFSTEVFVDSRLEKKAHTLLKRNLFSSEYGSWRKSHYIQKLLDDTVVKMIKNDEIDQIFSGLLKCARAIGSESEGITSRDNFMHTIRLVLDHLFLTTSKWKQWQNAIIEFMTSKEMLLMKPEQYMFFHMIFSQNAPVSFTKKYLNHCKRLTPSDLACLKGYLYEDLLLDLIPQEIQILILEIYPNIFIE